MQGAIPPPRGPGTLADLHPAYFALVMATGIVSIAARLVGLPSVPELLFGLNLVFYPVLWVLTIARALRHRDRFLADLGNHARGVGFFTMVAATCVMGSEFVVVADAPAVAFWLWVLGVVLYVALIYSVFTALTVKAEKPALADGINGGWLVSVVAAQSVAVLGAQLAVSSAAPEKLLFFSVTMWLGGGMLYFWIIALIFYRYTFFTLAPSDLAPPYWINMGAAAISTLAGTLLSAAAPRSPVIAQVLPFVRGLTLWWWATATWWIPMLLVLGVWRHVYRRFPLRYDALYWGAVFPLGMYTAATARLSRAVDAPYLFAIPQWFVFVALGAWILAFCGLVQRLARIAVSAR
jgi:tellurite resistance protein TehA-like permease